MFILEIIYFLLPAYFANMAPVICKKINFLKYPVDFNIRLRNRPVFGKNKTFRGLLFGILFSITIAYIQYTLLQIPFFKELSILNYQFWPLIGLLQGAGALFGDLIESFFKRQLNIQPGKPWIPFDQLDFIVGALLLILIIQPLKITFILTALVVSFALHITVNHTAFFLKIRNEKW